MLHDYKRWYVESESSLELLDSALGLLGIGLRQRGAAAEVRKALARENRAAAERRPAAATIPQIQSIIDELTALVFDRPEDCAQLHVALGRMHVTKKTEDADDLPEDIARLLAVNSPATFISSREGRVMLFASLPWVSRAQPEDLYWPKPSASGHGDLGHAGILQAGPARQPDGLWTPGGAHSTPWAKREDRRGTRRSAPAPATRSLCAMRVPSQLSANLTSLPHVTARARRYDLRDRPRRIPGRGELRATAAHTFTADHRMVRRRLPR